MEGPQKLKRNVNFKDTAIPLGYTHKENEKRCLKGLSSGQISK